MAGLLRALHQSQHDGHGGFGVYRPASIHPTFPNAPAEWVIRHLLYANGIHVRVHRDPTIRTSTPKTVHVWPVGENLLIYGRYFGMSRAALRPRIGELLRFAELTERAGDKVSSLSGGMKRRLTIVMDKGKIVAEGSPRGLIERYSTKEVVEVRFPVGVQETVEAEFDGLAKRVEILPDRILLYTDDGDATMHEVHVRGLEPESMLDRRSSLEDVFLRLTGRSLID